MASTWPAEWRHEGALTAGTLADRVRWQLDGWLSGSATVRPTAGIARLTLIPIEVVAARGRQLGFWGGETLLDERILARWPGCRPSSAARWGARCPSVRGGRSPAERVVRGAPPPRSTSPWPAPRSCPGAVAEPWPGQVPAPAPATVLAAPEPVEVLDASSRPVSVSARADVADASGSVHPSRRSAGGRGGVDGTVAGRRAVVGRTLATAVGHGSRWWAPTASPTCCASKMADGGWRPPTVIESLLIGRVLPADEQREFPRELAPTVQVRVAELARPAGGSEQRRGNARWLTQQTRTDGPAPGPAPDRSKTPCTSSTGCAISPAPLGLAVGGHRGAGRGRHLRVEAGGAHRARPPLRERRLRRAEGPAARRRLGRDPLPDRPHAVLAQLRGAGVLRRAQHVQGPGPDQRHRR